MDNNQKKIMPGCEKLTKPEEISALKNYLKQGIQENDSSLVIGDGNSLMSTPGDPILADDILDTQKKVLLDGSSVEIEIKKNKVGLEVPGDKAVPGSYLNKLEFSGESTESLLESSKNLTTLEDLSKITALEAINNAKNTLNLLEKQPIEITKQTIILDSGEQPGIESYREPLSASSDIDSSLLSFSPQSLQVSDSLVDDPKYFSKNILLEGKKEIDNLNNEVISITDEVTSEPEEKIIGLEKKDDVKITSSRINLDPGEEVIPDSSKNLFELLENTTAPYEKLETMSSPENPEIKDKKIFLSGVTEAEPTSDLVRGIQKNEVIPDLEKLSELSKNGSEASPEEFLEKLASLQKTVDIEEKKDILPSTTSENSELGSLLDIIKQADNLEEKKNILDPKKITLEEENNNISDSLKLQSNNNYSPKEKLVVRPLEEIFTKWSGDDPYERNPIGDNSSDLAGKEDKLLTEIKLRPEDAFESNNYTKWDGDDPYERNPIGDNNLTYDHYEVLPEYSNYLDTLDLRFNSPDWIVVYDELNNLIESSGAGGKEWSEKLLKFLQNSTAVLNYSSPVARPDHSDPYTSGSILNNFDFNDPASLAMSVASGAKNLMNKNFNVETLLRSLAELTAKYLPTTSGDLKQVAIDHTLMTLIQLRDDLRQSMKLHPGKLPVRDKSVKALSSFESELRIKDIQSWGIEETSDEISEEEENSGKRKNKKNKEVEEKDTSKLYHSDSAAYRNKSTYSIALPGCEDLSAMRKENKPVDSTIRNYPTISNGKSNQTVWNHDLNLYKSKDLIYFTDDYLSGTAKRNEDGDKTSAYKITALGLQTTFDDLILKVDSIPAQSLENLKELLDQSPYITTADSVRRMRMTLDSNHVWEIRLFPYLGDLNGNCSWLPNISEINAENWVDHKVKTTWGPWIPATSFELQSRKMTQKTLGLYDGEISYPVSMEFSNEVRLTLVDDQYKSWKRYFELCAECSTYLTEMVNKPGHKVCILDENGKAMYDDAGEIVKKDYTEITGEDLMSYTESTPIVKGVVCPGMYKNLSFRCLIYVMTPQLSTIQKFDLLLVLKDYSIEYTGETDANSPDLNISFSIVGENPYDAIPTRELDKYSEKAQKEIDEQQKQEEEERKRKKEEHEKRQQYLVEELGYDREKYGDWYAPGNPPASKCTKNVENNAVISE